LLEYLRIARFIEPRGFLIWRRRSTNLFGKWCVGLRPQRDTFLSIMAKNSIRGEKIKRNNSREFCIMCNTQSHEDILHMIWDCSHAQEVWCWVTKAIITAAGISQNFQFTATQAILGAKVLNGGKKFPQKLWDILRGHVMWETWKSRLRMENNHTVQGVRKTVIFTWARVRHYMRIDWKRLLKQTEDGKFLIPEAVDFFRRTTRVVQRLLVLLILDYIHH
jgi:hypothetical protein